MTTATSRSRSGPQRSGEGAPWVRAPIRVPVLQVGGQCWAAWTDGRFYEATLESVDRSRGVAVVRYYCDGARAEVPLQNVHPPEPADVADTAESPG